MKNILFVSILAFSATNLFAQEGIVKPNIQSAPIGYTLPDYNAVDVLTGRSLTVNQQVNDKGLLVIFSCNTCPYVIKNIKRTNEVLAKAKSLNIPVVIVNSNEAQRDEADSKNAMLAYGKEHKYPNYLYDEASNFANNLGATKTPEIFLFDKNSKLVYKGAMDDNPGKPDEAEVMYLANAMENLVANQPIEPKETKSVGCTIKRAKK